MEKKTQKSATNKKQAKKSKPVIQTKRNKIISIYKKSF